MMALDDLFSRRALLGKTAVLATGGLAACASDSEIYDLYIRFRTPNDWGESRTFEGISIGSQGEVFFLPYHRTYDEYQRLRHPGLGETNPRLIVYSDMDDSRVHCGAEYDGVEDWLEDILTHNKDAKRALEEHGYFGASFTLGYENMTSSNQLFLRIVQYDLSGSEVQSYDLTTEFEKGRRSFTKISLPHFVPPFYDDPEAWIEWFIRPP